MPDREITPAASLPPKNWWFVGGTVVMEFVSAIWVQKYGTNIPDWVLVSLFVGGAIPALIALIRYDRFLRAGGKIKQQIQAYPLSFIFVCVLTIMVAFAVGMTFVRHNQTNQGTPDKHSKNAPAAGTSAQPTAASPQQNYDPTSLANPTKPSLATRNPAPTGVQSLVNNEGQIDSATVKDSSINGIPRTGDSSTLIRVGPTGKIGHLDMSNSHINNSVPPSAPQQQQTAPTYQQNCTGACAQGPGAQAIFNQFGEPERKIDSKYVAGLVSVLKVHPGRPMIEGMSPGDKLEQQLAQIFLDAGWLPVTTGTNMAGQPFPDGVTVVYRGPTQVPGTPGKLPDDRPDVAALVTALINSGILGVTIVPTPTMEEHRISILIGSAPK